MAAKALWTTGAALLPQAPRSGLSAGPSASAGRPQAHAGAGSLEERAERRRPWLSTEEGGVRGGAGRRRREARRRSVAQASGNGTVHTQAFERVRTEAELLEAIRREAEVKQLPKQAGPGMELFYRNYRKAVESSGVLDAEHVAVSVMATIFDRIMVQFEAPFTFPSHHQRITAPYDYYMFGQNYVRPLIDFSTSYLGNSAIFDAMEDQLSQGDNVVLLANHQTEADPAVMALMLEHSHPWLATDLTYVAGDRVVLDPFCKPFSMGRNLLCVFSKKRLQDIPELAEQKAAANRRTLKEMALLFRKGGNLIWIAPSGGRDRPDPVTDEWVPAHFDSASVEMMRRLLQEAGRPGHLYPLALLCHDIMPPPRSVEKELGEVRVIGWHGVGVSAAPELNFEAIAQGLDKKQAREAFCAAAFSAVQEQYAMLKAAVHGGRGPAAAAPGWTLEQPWVRRQESITSAEAPALEAAHAQAAAVG